MLKNGAWIEAFSEGRGSRENCFENIFKNVTKKYMWFFIGLFHILVRNIFVELPHPWIQQQWLPGVLNKAQMEAIIDVGLLIGADKSRIGIADSALDLTLSGEAYKMKKGCIKPIGKKKNYDEVLSKYANRIEAEYDNDDTFRLEVGECYVFLINEKLDKEINQHPFYGQATAKSTVGRLDVIARLIIDGMDEYETFRPEGVSTGKMFLEITPITFNVIIKKGKSLTQLRFFYGEIEHSVIKDEFFIKSVLINSRNDNLGTLSVDMTDCVLPNNEKAVAFCALKDAYKDPGLDVELFSNNYTYSSEKFWEIRQSENIDGIVCVEIVQNRFYILRSKERIKLPRGVCIYCRAMDETLGEMRIHYAGFVHPLFGKYRKDGKEGAPLIFEVRGHNVKVVLTDEEILARLHFYRMSEAVDERSFCEKEKEMREKQERGNKLEGYTNQELTLSKIFKEWGT